MSVFVNGVDDIPSNSESRPFAKVVIRGKTFSTLLDTVLAVDLIGPRVAEYLRHQGLSPVERSVALKNGENVAFRYTNLVYFSYIS